MEPAALPVKQKVNGNVNTRGGHSAHGIFYGDVTSKIICEAKYPRSNMTDLVTSHCHKGQELDIGAIAEWLSPCNFKKTQEDHASSCFKRVGQWLLDAETFKSWADGGRPWYLRCHGEQGTGKVGFQKVR